MKPGTSQKPARAVTLSIFVRCALLIAAATFTVVAVMAMESSKLVRDVAVAGVADRAASVNRFLSSQTSGGIRFGKEDAILGVLTSASEMSEGYMSSGLAMDRDGAVLAMLGAAAGQGSELAQLAAAAIATGDRAVGPDGLLQADPVVFGPDREVIGAVATAWSADPILASLRDSTIMILAVAGTVFVIALAGSVFVLRKTIAAPLRRVGIAMKAVVGGDLAHTIPETARRDEIGLMARDLEEFRGIMSGVAEAERSREEMRAAQAEVVEALRTGLASLRDGDLAYRLETPLSPDYDQLRKDFNTASERLHDAIAEVAEMAVAMRGEVQDIVGAADDLSRRTEQQAATLEETAAAVAEITAAVSSAAEGARQATEVVREARGSAESTGGIVGDAVAAMDEISASSDQISKIIGVIDDIAFQTNLLALNAGVEAARAGDAGRGFAVVASEVRALAQRSSEAAREINDLITTSGQHVKSGARLVGQAGDALRQIAASVTGISDHVTEIVTSSQEQSASLSEVNSAMGQLDQVTQQNAAMFEETTAASHALVQQADRLTAGIARFRVAGARATAPATHTRPRDAAATPMPLGPATAPMRTSGALALDADADDWSEF